MLLLTLLACRHYDGPLVRHLPRGGITPGAWGDDTGVIDTADTVETGDTADSADTVDTSDSGTSPETCWLGADRGWTTCEPTIPYDSGFGSDYTYPAPYDGSPQYAVPVRFVDIDAVEADLAFAPNFIVSEFMESWKGRYGILQDHMTGHLQDVRDFIGGPLIINSGYRSPGYNAEIGGVEYSRHMYGDGADLQADGWSVEELGDVCTTLDAGYVGLYEDGHTHCDWRDDGLDPGYFDGSRGAGAAPRPVTTARLERTADEWSAPATGFDEGEPLRRWTARAADGAVLDSATGRTFLAPVGTVRLDVQVGGQAWATTTLPTE